MDGGLSAETRLGLIGGGTMAEALARSVSSSGLVPAGKIVVFDPVEARREVFRSLGAKIAPDGEGVLRGAELIVLAIKPQVMDAALREIAPAARDTHLFVSIAAGVTIARIELRLPARSRVIRTMPNTPMQIGRGATALSRGTHATDRDMAVAESLFAASGTTVVVDERQLDAVTAVSGSGPAYAFFLAECMIEAGVAEGLPAPLARLLAGATIEGAGAYLAASPLEAAELRQRVTSPGGTTQAAFSVLQAHDCRTHLVTAIRRAAARSRELSGA